MGCGQCGLKELLNKLPSCGCSVEKNGFIAGWFGLAWRSVFSVLASYYVGELTKDSPTIYKIILIGALSYLVTTFIANIFFLVALIQTWPNTLLPYILIEGIELSIQVFLLISVSTFLEALDANAILWLSVPSIICIIALNVYFFSYSLMLFKEVETKAKAKKKEAEDEKTARPTSSAGNARKSLKAIRLETAERYRNRTTR
ncbi:hypothetical protein JTB14_029287 [Gonioctena quinquepunctata]|nr:hypothetical protein JTB14_029287 [Gonioctena quinquepunctata]